MGVPRGSCAAGMVARHPQKPAGRLQVDGSDSRGSETVAGPPQGLPNQHCTGEGGVFGPGIRLRSLSRCEPTVDFD